MRSTTHRFRLAAVGVVVAAAGLLTAAPAFAASLPTVSVSAGISSNGAAAQASASAAGSQAEASTEATAPDTPTADVPPVLANAGAAGNHLLEHLQHEHLDQPLLGFGPAIADPQGWATGHLIPVFVDAAYLALTGEEYGGYQG
jgi:hypothetical protein